MRRALACALLWLGAGPVQASDGWKLALERDGVRVEQQEVPGRGLPVFRARGRIAAPLEDVLAVILDVERHPEWMPRCDEIRVLERREPLGADFYVRMGMPWPVSDRDAVLTSDTTRPSAEESLTRFRLGDQARVAPVSGVVRMPTLDGHYALHAVDASTTHVEYRVDADPGGMIPDWLAARAATDDPLHTLLNLRARATSAR